MLISSFENSFLPICGDNPQVLILGTLPGRASLKAQQYYAHPRNLFWRIATQLHNCKTPQSYPEKIEFAKRHQLALWDVCKQAIRPGSLDQHISNEVPNAIHDFLDEHPTIQSVLFNGKSAERLYDRYFSRRQALNYFTMLSTSPANAAYSFEQKLENWKPLISSKQQ